MGIYILDAHALVAIEDRAEALRIDAGDVWEAMTDLAEAGDLLCPPVVIRECRKYAAGEESTRWVRAASGHFRDSSEPWQDMEQVLTACPEMLDPDEPEENPQVVVLALALYRRRTGSEVSVVTEQWVDMPSRLSLGNAANRVEVRALTVADFLREITA